MLRIVLINRNVDLIGVLRGFKNIIGDLGELKKGIMELLWFFDIFERYIEKKLSNIIIKLRGLRKVFCIYS